MAAYADRVAELSAAAERNRVARDIHDGLGHHLTAIAVLLEKAAAFRDRDPAAADRAIDDAQRVGAAGAGRRTPIGAARCATRRAPFRLPAALADLVRQGGDAPAGGHRRRRRRRERLRRPRADGAVPGRAGGADQRPPARRAPPGGGVRSGFDGPAPRLVVADDGAASPARRPGGLRPGSACASGCSSSAAGSSVDSAPGAGTRVTVTIPRVPGAGR